MPENKVLSLPLSFQDMSKHLDKLKELSVEVEDLPQVYDFSGDLHKYYEACDEYWQLRSRLQVGSTQKFI